MILEMIGTISAEVKSKEDPLFVAFMEKFHVEPSETFVFIHGKVSDIYRVVAR